MLFQRHSLPRPLLKVALGLCILTFLVVLGWRPGWRQLNEESGETEFKNVDTISIPGYTGTRVSYEDNCDEIAFQGSLGVSQSVYLEDDIVRIAGTITHSMIDYSNLNGLSVDEQVQLSWLSMAGSSVWHQDLEVFFSVKRIFYYNRSNKYHPKISFLYAQIYNEVWDELENFTLKWQGDNITFPRILSIVAPYTESGRYYGPEDPRIILEDIPGAEPVIVFNMMEDIETKNRAMHLHRPFSNFTTTLRIENKEPNRVEKNWSPFFMPRENTDSQERWPSRYVYFVYNWYPLVVIHCHLLNGYCSFAYVEDQPVKTIGQRDPKDAIHGGTNLAPFISPAAGLTSFIGFPRTKVFAGCNRGAIYRPMLSLLTTNGTHFTVEYASRPLEFGHSVLNQAQYDDMCNTGRILLVNSIARFDYRRDIVTLSYTVDDSTVQVGQVHGVRRLIGDVYPSSNPKTAARDFPMRWERETSGGLLDCALQAAVDDAFSRVSLIDGTLRS